MSPTDLLKFVTGVGPRRAELLARLDLLTVHDLLHHFPRRYEDRRELRRIRDAAPGETQTLYGEIASIRERPLRGKGSLVEARLADATGGLAARGVLDLVWFGQAYVLEWLRPGARVFAYGHVKLRGGRLQMASPEFEVENESDDAEAGPSPHMQRIAPVYALTRGVHQRFLRALVFRVLQRGVEWKPGPFDHFHRAGPSARDAFRAIHFPESWKELADARGRLVFEEEFAFASHLTFRRNAFRCRGGEPFRVTDELDRKIRSLFPFELTSEQDAAVADIARDLGKATPMYRLIQGDVGTGKTAVALYAMLAAVRNRRQAALMAPTELLAEQHHRTISRALEAHPVRVALLTGSVRGGARRSLLERITQGREHIVVGTQALVREGVTFHRLGLCVIDEQHRFGVLDRMRIREKGSSPHVLVMSATPIPRSLCLTCYGDLDLSVLRSKPRGRLPVKTYLVTSRTRARAMEIVRAELRKGRQAYFVYPTIEESESLTLPAAVKAREELETRVFPEFRVGMVHGALPSAEKERELERFRAGEVQVLVATVVVEVGIDVPNATVLFVEDASRFGLAQLHQLRGRVGRGESPGICLVGVGSAPSDVKARLKVFASTDDGFRIAEEDLKLRGPGDFLGVRQSGRPHFILGNPLEDLPAFLRVKRLAEEFWADERHAPFRKLWAGQLGLGRDAEPSTKQGFVGLD